MPLVYTQQGLKLVGSGTPPTDRPGQGNSVAISADGSVLVVGAGGDSARDGEVFIFVGSLGVWTETQLLPNPSNAGSAFGTSVAVSDDGVTILVGAPGANFTGADDPRGSAYVYVLDSGTWVSEAELSPDDMIDRVFYGRAVALSADGDVAVVGGTGDSDNTGAAWVWKHTGSWSQDAKLVGSGAAEDDLQGSSVTLSGDGLTAAFGGNGSATAWVFADSGGWTEQAAITPFAGGDAGSIALSTDGNTGLFANRVSGDGEVNVYERTGDDWAYVTTLTPNDAVSTPSPAVFGWSVAVTSDGLKAAIGGYQDDDALGAFWVFSDEGSGWAQRGDKYTPLDWDDSGPVWVGYSADITPDGRYVAVGGPMDNNVADAGVGASWIFARQVLAVSVGAHFPRT